MVNWGQSGAVIPRRKREQTLTTRSGPDLALVFGVLNSGWGRSFMLSNKAPIMPDRDAACLLQILVKGLSDG